MNDALDFIKAGFVLLVGALLLAGMVGIGIASQMAPLLKNLGIFLVVLGIIMLILIAIKHTLE